MAAKDRTEAVEAALRSTTELEATAPRLSDAVPVSPRRHALENRVDEEHAVDLSVVIPAYRCSAILPVLCERLDEVLSQLTSRYEVILVDDGSPDDSWAVIERLAKEHKNLLGIRFSRNFGQHYALTAGLDAARGRWVVTMDCDLQDSPQDIPALLAKARDGFDIVLAKRAHRKDHAVKRLSSRAFHRVFAWLTNYRMDPDVGTFRIMSAQVVESYCGMREHFRLFGGMIEWLGFPTAFVSVQHAPRYEGKSTYNWRGSMRLAIDGLVGFSNRPLYFSIGIGIVVSLLSGLYGAYQLLRYVWYGSFAIPGWLSTVTISAFLGGLTLLNLGVIGIYIGRIYDHTKGRPLYVIARVVSSRSSLEH